MEKETLEGPELEAAFTDPIPEKTTSTARAYNLLK